MFGPFSGWEILIILVIVLLIFGPGRLGELGKSLGEGIRNFKKAVSGELEETQKPTQTTTTKVETTSVKEENKEGNKQT
ncbi:MAG: twin-arginine translocase TatA/TatE family subunit [Aquificae bacterium]|nr:twin-arginine translocase TatA/TatE family subunit [Aquificota bacterium]